MNTSLGQSRLLIVDDEPDLLKGLQRTLAYEFKELEILTASQSPEALYQVQREPIDVILTDIRMPDLDGLEHFVTKPFDKEVLLRTIRKALERNSLIRENLSLQQRAGEKAALANLVGQSPPIRLLLETIYAIARTNYTVLIRGESGTGKELVARAIHALSSRRNRRLVNVNCPAIPEHLLESELFGHKKGSFTGADTDQRGLFAEADGSSLFLDEIGDIPTSIQTKLLRALQEQEIKPLGAARPHHVDVRILAATNQDLEEKIRDRSFREDLFYRLNVVTIRTPTLKEIKADIPLLVNHFTRLACIELGINLKRFSPRAFEVLMGRPWPGNVRELQNIVRRAVIFCPESIIKPEDVELEQEGAGQGKRICLELDKLGEGLEPYKQAKERVLQRFTLKYVSQLLEKTGGNVTRAAELSGLSRVALQKIRRRLEASSGAATEDFSDPE